MKADRDIAHTITAALKLQETVGPGLMQDQAFQALLGTLDRSIENTRQVMIETGMVKECAACASEGGGVCCVRRVTYNCDSVTLLINLLLGITLKVGQDDSDTCRFLSERGCTLRARQVICINYICPRLKKNIPDEKLIRFQEVAGEEMDALFRLEENIKRRLLRLL